MPDPGFGPARCIVRGATLESVAGEITRGGSTVFTLNVSHLHTLALDPEFRESYRNATTVTLDSNCLNRYFLGSRVKVVTGSDLVHFMCSTAALDGKSVLILGNLSRSDAARLLPGCAVNVIQPPWGFIRDDDAVRDLVEACRCADPDVLFIAVGAPQSEKLVVRLRRAGLRRASILCCGASFEFELGIQKRSPKIFRVLGLEWTWRMLQEPWRLGRRYLGDAVFLLSRYRDFWRLGATRQLPIGDLIFEFRDQLARSAPVEFGLGQQVRPMQLSD